MCRSCLNVDEDRAAVILGKDRIYGFDRVYSFDSRQVARRGPTPLTEQQELYSDMVQPLVDSVFSGYNATVLAYGQTVLTTHPSLDR